MFGDFWEHSKVAEQSDTEDPLLEDELGDLTRPKVAEVGAEDGSADAFGFRSKLRSFDVTESDERSRVKYAGKVVSRRELAEQDSEEENEDAADSDSDDSMDEEQSDDSAVPMDESANELKVRPMSAVPLIPNEKRKRRQRTANEMRQIRKSKAVSRQSGMFDRLVSVRIRLQKSLQLSQKLPPSLVSAEYLRTQPDSDSEKQRLLSLMAELNQSTLDVCQSLCRLQTKVCSSDAGFSAKMGELEILDRAPEGSRDGEGREHEWQPQSEDSEDDSLGDEILVSEHASKDDEDAPAQITVVDWPRVYSATNTCYAECTPLVCSVLHDWDCKLRLVDSYHRSKKSGATQMLSLADKMREILANPRPVLSKMQGWSKFQRVFGVNVNKDGVLSLQVSEEEKVGSSENSTSQTASKDARIEAGLEELQVWKQQQRVRVQLESPLGRLIGMESLNDSLFYKRMLREMTEVGGNSGMIRALDHGSRIERAKQRAKQEFNESRRKLKFTIRPDMENFMAPRFTHDAGFHSVAGLYRSLFQA